LGKVKLRLKLEPAFRTAAKGLRQPDGHFRGNACMAVKQQGKGLAGYAETLGCPGNGQAQGLEAQFPDDLARMWGILHGHGVLLLVIINQIDIDDLTFLKTEKIKPRASAHKAH